MATVATQLNSAAGFASGETVTAVKLNSLVNGSTVTEIVNADIASGAAIVDSKLATISTAGKVSNSATTATNANTASAIVARDASGNFSAGTITANLTGNVTGSATTLSTASGSAPVYGCRAWVNFDGTRNSADDGTSTVGGNVKIRSSGNVSSVVKTAVGRYTINLTTTMTTNSYSVSFSTNRTVPYNYGIPYVDTLYYGLFTVGCGDSSTGNFADCTLGLIQIFGN